MTDLKKCQEQKDRLYQELLQTRQKLEVLEQRMEFNPDWLQCSEDAKRLYAEIRAEYLEYFETQQKTIEKWRDKYRQSTRADDEVIRELAKALRAVKKWEPSIDNVTWITIHKALTKHAQRIKEADNENS